MINCLLRCTSGGAGPDLPLANDQLSVVILVLDEDKSRLESGYFLYQVISGLLTVICSLAPG